MVSSRTLFTFTLAATALGINCRDSGACNLNNASLQEVLTQVPQIQAQGNDRHHYATGVQLACSGGKYSRIASTRPEHRELPTEPPIYCKARWTTLTGCTQSGSNPTAPGNDVSKGELTVNIVSAPCCSGNCHCPI